jgi:hypothetical protein
MDTTKRRSSRTTHAIGRLRALLIITAVTVMVIVPQAVSAEPFRW